MTNLEITSKNPRQLANIQWLLRQDDAVYESHLDGDVQVVKYSPKGAYPVAAIFKDKKKDAVSHYRYKSEERRDQAIQEAIESSLSQKRWKEERKAKAKPVELKVGDILYTSWGYDQTNVDFFQIVGLVGKATAEYVSIGSKQVRETSWCSADVSPDPSYKGSKIHRGRIGQWGVKIGSNYASKTTLDRAIHSSWGH